MIFARLLVTVALLCAMTAIGWAHRIDRNTQSAEFAAYVALGGSLADICGDTGGPTGAAGSNCDACRLTGEIIQPGATVGPEMVLTDASRTLRSVAIRFRLTQRLDPARLSRAPPQA